MIFRGRRRKSGVQFRRLHTSLLIILTYICHLHLSHFGLFLVSFWYLGRSKVCGDCSKFTAKHLRAAEVRAAEGKMSVTLGLFGRQNCSPHGAKYDATKQVRAQYPAEGRARWRGWQDKLELDNEIS